MLMNIPDTHQEATLTGPGIRGQLPPNILVKGGRKKLSTKQTKNSLDLGDTQTLTYGLSLNHNVPEVLQDFS